MDSDGYCPLQDNEIRVLRLSRQDDKKDNASSGGAHMPFCLSLERVSLAHDPLPSFTALSYAWGSEEATVTLKVSNMQLAVTKNLYTILETLVSHDPPERLWIDAICINQQDIAERAIQVRLMGSVYSRASLVLVFLSPVSAPFDIGMSFLERAATHVDEHYEPSLSPHIAIDGHTLHSETLRDSLIGFFGTAWWTRVWTVQEFALARRVLFQCGQRRIDRVMLGRAFETLRDHERDCCWASLRVADTYARGYLDIPSSANGGLSIFSSVLRYDQIHTMINPDDPRGFDFVELMTTFRPRLCSDPCDRIYGMLGLKLKDEQIRNLIQTHHYTSAAILFQDVAMIVVEQSGTLDILSHVLPPSFAEPTVPDLPSWVPDWNARLDASFHLTYSGRTSRLDLYDTSVHPKPSWALTSTRKIITEARFMGNIVADASGYPRIKSALSGKLLLDEWVKVAGMGTDTEQRWEAGEPRWERERDFSNLLSGHLILKRWTENLAESSNLKAYQMWCAWFASEKPSSLSTNARSDVREFDEFVRANTLGRRLFRTDSGWIGFGPESLQVSDSLVMIPGGKVPYILRQSPTGNGKDYVFLGDAFAQEAMSGDTLSWSSSKGVPTLTKIELI